MKTLRVTVVIVATLLCWGGPVVSQSACRGSSEASGEASNPPCLSLKLELVPEVRAGESVALTLKLKNLCEHPLEFFLGGRPAHDFVVSDADGTEIWRWLHEADILMILEARTLKPDEVLTFTARWDRRDNEGNLVAPGDYWVKGRLHGEPPQVLETAPRPLLVLPKTP